MIDQRMNLLNRWAREIANAAQAGALDKGKPLSVLSVETICGPRAGALEIHAGFDTGRMLGLLSASDFALHRQFIPWPFIGQPTVYLQSRFVRLEAGWPDTLAERNIALRSLAPYPKGSAHWIAGKNEIGATVALGLSDAVPHFLMGGASGSGKTWAMRAAVAQLATNGGNQFVLVDGKFGDGLGVFQHLPGLVGPVATELADVRGALAWAVGEMRERYSTGRRGERVVVVIDEVQEFSGANGDPFATEMIRRLVAQGRGAGVHCIVGTQHPTIESAFTDADTRASLVGRVALRVESYKASEVIVGGPEPRADHLYGAGDAYVVVPGTSHRVQIAYVPEEELARLNTGTPRLEGWPEPDPQAAGSLPERVGWQYSGEELAVSLVNAHLGAGRPSLVKALEENGLGRPGVERAGRLLGLGRDARAWLEEHGWNLCAQDGN